MIIRKSNKDQELEINKLKLDYAWKWFNFHATQSTTVFNYFLVITGILATALFNLFKDNQLGFAATVSFLGVLCSISFLVLDIRNHRLI